MRVESRDFSQAEKEETVCKAKKKSQNDNPFSFKKTI
jgi:hypothetical protein